MSTEDLVWKSLLAQSAPSFAAETALPLGLAARVLAGVRDERRQAAAWDCMGRRAILASFLVVATLAIFTFAHATRDDVDPSIRTLAVVENVQVF